MSRLAGLVVVALVVELLVLVAIGRRLGRGLGRADAVSAVLPGAALLAAIFLALHRHHVAAFAAALALAGVLHANDLYRRLRR